VTAMAMLCDGVTVYKGLKVTDARLDLGA